MSDNLLNNKITEVSNLLAEIEKVNTMIRMHRKRGIDGDFMASQYEQHKMSFIHELQTHLLDFELNVFIENKAA